MRALAGFIWMSVFLVAGISSHIYAFDDLEFVDASNGWALSTYQILHTSDGGQTWSEQQAGEDEFYICMSFVSPAEGWIVSESGYIFHTDDSGNTWVLQASIGEISGEELGYEPGYSVDFVDPDNGWITVIMEAESFESFGEGMVLHTSDGGETWDVQKTEQDVFYFDVDFVSPTEGWIVGGRFEYEGFEVKLQGMILHTDDGGDTWTTQKEEKSGFFSHVQFIDPNEGWALGYGGLGVHVFHSVDGGITWVSESVLRYMEAEDFQFVDSNEGWIVGWEGVMHTTDGGKTWTEHDIGLDEYLELYAVHFVNPDQGWIAGYGFEGEMIIHTSDGGDTWVVQYGEEFVSPESEPAALISTIPAAGGSQPGNAPVTFIFDKPMESAAVSGAPGTVSVTWEQVVWTPEKPYPEGVVILTLTGEDADGFDVSATLTYTATEIDETPPSLVDDECDPRNGAINVDPADYAELTIVFSEPVATAKVFMIDQDFRFMDRLSIDGKVMTIIFLQYTMVHEAKYTIVLVATDRAGNESELTYSFTTMPKGYAPPEEPTEDFSHVFSMSLDPGLNMISLPLKPMNPYTARSFAEELSATVVIKYDGSLGRFVGFSLDAPDDGFDIEGGYGYIVNVPEGGTVKFTGAAWANEVPDGDSSAPPIEREQGAWAFVTSGFVSGDGASNIRESDCIVTVKNLRTGVTIADTVRSSGYFAIAWADLNRNTIVEAYDRLEMTVVDSSGSIMSGPFIHQVTLEEIRNALVNIQFRLGDVIPAKPALLQNYPNPFNPDTWIPYQLTKDSEVTIRIFSVQGELVRELELGHRPAGVYVSQDRAAYWDGRNEAFEQISSGIYFYTIQAGEFAATKKMAVAK